MDFYKTLELLRVRIGMDAALNSGRIRTFKELLDDHADEIPVGWYWEFFDELELQGRLGHPSQKMNRGDLSRRCPLRLAGTCERRPFQATNPRRR
jgi:hypothetical protein